MRKSTLFLLFFSFFLIMPGLNPTLYGKENKSVSRKIVPIRLGIHSYDNMVVTRKRVTPLVKYLATILKRPIKLVITKDYQELVRRFVSRELTLAVLPPYAYVKTSRIYNLKLLANLELNNNIYYRGAIIVRRSDNIKNIKELKNKKFGFVSKSSASGYLYPLVRMAKLDIVQPEKFFSKVEFLKTHSNVIKALVNGKIDGGAVFEAEILNFSKTGGDISNIKVITRTPQIPFDAFVAQYTVPGKICKKITNALLKYRYLKGKTSKNGQLDNWGNPNDKLYDSVREAMNFLKSYREKKLKVLRFGLFPRRDVKSELKNFKPFISYLENETGYKIVVKFSPNYLDVGRRLLVGDIDFAIIAPFAYIQTTDNTKIKPVILGQQSIHNTTQYRSLLLSKKYSNLKELKNKILALVDPNSSSGRLIPTAYFKKNNINITKYFKKVYYAGSHFKALNDLLSDKADICAVSSSTYHYMMKKNKKVLKKLHIIYKSELLPRESIVARGDLPEKIRKTLKNALLKLNDKTNEKYVRILKGIKYDAIRNASDSVYDVLRKIIPLAMRRR